LLRAFASQVSDFRQSLVFAVRRFRHAEYTSSCLPTDARRSRFGTVSGRNYWQALAGLSWLSFSSSGVSPECRPLSSGRSRTVTRSRTPHASSVVRSTRPRTPLTRFESLSFLTCFEPSRPVRPPLGGATRYVPVAHIRGRWWIFLWDRTLGLLWFLALLPDNGSMSPGLLQGASLELEEPLSWRIQLYEPSAW
jgi:hypothetical protein